MCRASEYMRLGTDDQTSEAVYLNTNEPFVAMVIGVQGMCACGQMG